jgi:sugar phosphate isomerase/epimerase
MLSRRSFIKRSAATAATTIATSGILSSLLSSCSGQGKLKKIGFISGIIGRELEGDWKSILKKTVEYGFSEIEIGDYLGDTASSFLAYCKEIGLTPIAGGVGFNTGVDDTTKRLEALKELGLKYAVAYWPWLTSGPFTFDDCQRSADILNNLGFRCKQMELTLCWHNHDKEFIAMNGGIPFDFLMIHTDPALVKCELDIYWAKKGGADPLDLLKKYAGRIPILHVKDMAQGPEQDFACPGSGIIDFPSIFNEARLQGITHYMVERDNVPDGMACLQSSGAYLRNLTW